MFEFFFKYPAAVFSRGTLVLLGTWPVWSLIAAIVLAAAGLWFWVHRNASGSARVNSLRSVAVWLLQTLMASLLLLMLWHPALSVATLRPQQNIVAVVVDDSASMAQADEAAGATRRAAATQVLNSGLLNALKDKFQVRLYRLTDRLDRFEKFETLTSSAPATHIGEGLKQVVADAASLPIGAVILASDGADNSGGVDLETVAEFRRQRIPIHTIGFGREKAAHDVEIGDVVVPARALPDSRLAAQVSFHQQGFKGQKAKLMLREGKKILAQKEVTFKDDGAEQSEAVPFNAGAAAVHAIEIALDPLPGEDNVKNNALTRIVNVDARKPRILYMEGEPRWEFKFLRRAVEEDSTIDLVTILRTTQNKIYRQGIANPDELKDGFPTKVEELFAFEGLIIGSVDAPYLTPGQQTLIKDFVDRRGGGVLFLGGKDALADGGWKQSADVDLIPTVLPDRKDTFLRAGAMVELTAAGRDSLITRIEEDPAKNTERWKKLPYIMNFQDPGQPKPGATVLVDALPMTGGRIPLLITQNYGRGRTALFATGGSWRWQMLQPVADKSHEMFYQQLLRWLVADTPRRVITSTPKQVISDDSHASLRAEIRDRTYLPASDATAEAHVLGPEGLAETVQMRPDPIEQGVYTADYTTPKPGSYLVEVVATRGTEELGRDTITFRREDGVAENFHTEQNRELLEKLASETGGRYYKPEEAQKLGKDISYSEAGITVRETRDLWDMPIVFLVLLMLRSGEWLLRRKWGVI
ncbi:MAG TPA: hypothetical protein VGR73_12415 [Bryobacteraceae bacterium]|nr:hypothetical protein [Bryobacteraceae bacterium]